MIYSLSNRYLKILQQLSALSHQCNEFPYSSYPGASSDILREWIGKLTKDDCEKLCLWGIPT